MASLKGLILVATIQLAFHLGLSVGRLSMIRFPKYRINTFGDYRTLGARPINIPTHYTEKEPQCSNGFIYTFLNWVLNGSVSDTRRYGRLFTDEFARGEDPENKMLSLVDEFLEKVNYNLKKDLLLEYNIDMWRNEFKNVTNFYMMRQNAVETLCEMAKDETDPALHNEMAGDLPTQYPIRDSWYELVKMFLRCMRYENRSPMKSHSECLNSYYILKNLKDRYPVTYCPATEAHEGFSMESCGRSFFEPVFNKSNNPPLTANDTRLLYGPVYSMLYRAVSIVNTYAEAHRNIMRLNCNDKPDIYDLPDLIPNYALCYIIYITELMPKYEYPVRLPLAYLLREKNNDGNYILVFKSEVAQYELELMIENNKMESAEYLGLGKGRVQGSYLDLGNSVFSSLLDHLQGLKKTSLIVTGHSLGAAIGQIVAYRWADMRTFDNIAGVFFGSPNIFDEEAAKDYGQKVASTMIYSNMDPYAFFPCLNYKVPPPNHSRAHVQALGFVATPGRVFLNRETFNTDLFPNYPRVTGNIYFHHGGPYSDTTSTLEIPESLQYELIHRCYYDGVFEDYYCSRPRKRYNFQTCPMIKNIKFF